MEKGGRMVRGFFGPLQPFPDRVRDPNVQRRTHGLSNIERHNPLSDGQASASQPGEEDSQGASRGDRRQEATIAFNCEIKIPTPSSALRAGSPAQNAGRMGHPFNISSRSLMCDSQTSTF